MGKAKSWCSAYVASHKEIVEYRIGRTGITYQEVAQAIVKLKKKEKNLTVENIRQILTLKESCNFGQNG